MSTQNNIPISEPNFFSQFTDEQMRAQYGKNATELRAMHDKAKRSGKKVSGYTEQQLDAMASDFEYKAKNFKRN